MKTVFECLSPDTHQITRDNLYGKKHKVGVSQTHHNQSGSDHKLHTFFRSQKCLRVTQFHHKNGQGLFECWERLT